MGWGCSRTYLHEEDGEAHEEQNSAAQRVEDADRDLRALGLAIVRPAREETDTDGNSDRGRDAVMQGERERKGERESRACACACVRWLGRDDDDAVLACLRALGSPVEYDHQDVLQAVEVRFLQDLPKRKALEELVKAYSAYERRPVRLCLQAKVEAYEDAMNQNRRFDQNRVALLFVEGSFGRGILSNVGGGIGGALLHVLKGVRA